MMRGLGFFLWIHHVLAVPDGLHDHGRVEVVRGTNIHTIHIVRHQLPQPGLRVPELGVKAAHELERALPWPARRRKPAGDAGERKLWLREVRVPAEDVEYVIRAG